MNRLFIEILIAAALFGAGIVWLDRHDAAQQAIGEKNIKDADKAGVERQKKIDDVKIADAGRIKANELQEIKDRYSVGPVKLTSHIVCHSTVPFSTSIETQLHGSEGGPTVDRTGHDDVHPDISYALKVFAHRLDQLNAEARQLNNETH